MATQLAIVEIDGIHYYQDDRLKEYRQTNHPLHRITFDEIGERKVKLVKEKKELLPTQRVRKSRGRFIWSSIIKPIL